MANLNIKNRFGTNVTYSGVSKVKFDGTISGSTVTFVLPSAGSDIPDWIAGSPSSLWSAAYFNRAINWSSILSGLTYDSNHQCIVGESTHDDARTGYFYAYDATSDTAGMYILYYQDQLTGDMTPIYSTAAGTISGYDVTAGWNNTIVSLATSNSSVTFDEDILSAISDVSQIATGVSLAFGTQEATVTPSTAQQVISPGTGYSALSKVTVAAMPSGTAGTPTATKSPVSNHSVTVTPSVTNTTGYITGQTKTGTAVTVSASELVSGTKSITENGTNIDVATYEKVDVNVAGLVPSGNPDIVDLSEVNVAGKATARISEAQRAKIISSNLRYGESILGVYGLLQPRPVWLCDGDNASWQTCYFNTELDLASVLPTLDYDGSADTDTVMVGASIDSSLWNGLFFAVRSGNAYALIYGVLSTGAFTPIYATAAGTFTVYNDGDPSSVVCAAGWNHSSISMPSGTRSCSFRLLAPDVTTVAAGSALAFGDYVTPPSGTLAISENGEYDVTSKASVIVNVAQPTPGSSITITANGTYTWEQLSQYATIIVDVPTGGGGENQSVSGDTLIFDGDTAVSGDTLVLASDAELDGDTLIFTTGGEPEVEGDELVLDGSEAVSGDTLTLDGTLDGDTLILD